jgi:hypothetical protein
MQILMVNRLRQRICLLFMCVVSAVAQADGIDVPDRQVFFGGLHTHTGWSVDTYNPRLTSGPEDAYRFARGEAITHVTGEQIQLKSGALDFFSVTDHSEYLGLARTLKKDSPLAQNPFIKRLLSDDIKVNFKARLDLRVSRNARKVLPELQDPFILQYPWQQLIKITERFNKPNEFTTFVGFEWTSQPNRANMHRVVLFGDSIGLPERPISAFDTEEVAGLWDWLDAQREKGADVLAIPHNANISDGRMFPVTGEYVSAARSAQRLRNEPLVEIMQAKGASETHPSLSSNDEWADFAIRETLFPAAKDSAWGASGPSLNGKLNGSYMREAWLNGLYLQAEQGSNPYVFGVVASSDTHSTAAPYEEANYFGSKGVVDATPKTRLGIADESGRHRRDRQEPSMKVKMERNGPGLAGVWAEANTRAALFAALQRKETFGTSGPRITVRMFAGWEFTEADAADGKTLAAAGYGNGVPMGGRLAAQPEGAGSPNLLLFAVQDPDSAPLQRLQIIKGWLEEGQAREQVYDALCADNGKPDQQTHRCPASKAAVNLQDCSYSRDKGDSKLLGSWTDPDFDPKQQAFYYVRVLENPTCRWSTWDAVRLGVPPPKEAPVLIQERAWTSPVWYEG